MSIRYKFLASAAFSGLAATAHGADLNVGPDIEAALDQQSLPAVSEINGKLSLVGGWADTEFFDDRGLFGVTGALSIPVAHQWGIQLDGTAFSDDGDFTGSVAGHLFWRDPAHGLIGLYTSYTTYDGISTNAWHVGIEAEKYYERITLTGLAGWEHIDLPSPFSDDDNFFGLAQLDYYFTDDFVAGLGLRYEAEVGYFTASAEYQFANFAGNGVSVFGEGRVGEDENAAIFGGIRMYFGPDKSLIGRHREDDPLVHSFVATGISALGQACKSAVGSGGGPIFPRIESLSIVDKKMNTYKACGKQTKFRPEDT